MTTKKIFLYFPKSETEKPIVYHLVKDYNLIINIFRAKITPEEEGYLLIDMTGSDEDIERGLAFVSTFDVIINGKNKGLYHDSDKCTHCGNCLSHCPTKALHVENQRSRKIAFDEAICIECLACVKNCPFGACISIF